MGWLIAGAVVSVFLLVAIAWAAVSIVRSLKKGGRNARH